MASTVRLLAIVDLEGQVVAAQVADQDTSSPDREVPTAQLQPLKDQRIVSFEVPQEVMELPGPDFHHFLAHVMISWPANVQIPKIEVVKKGEVKRKDEDVKKRKR
jgi:hypothetical protein